MLGLVGTKLKDMVFNPGDSIKVKLKKQDDGRWMVQHIVGQPTTTQKKNKRQKHVKKKEKRRPLAKRIKSMLKGPQGYLRKMYLLALETKASIWTLLMQEHRALGPFIEYVELPNSRKIICENVSFYGRL